MDDVFKSNAVTLGIERTGVSGRLHTGCGTRSQYQVPGAGTYSMCIDLKNHYRPTQTTNLPVKTKIVYQLTMTQFSDDRLSSDADARVDDGDDSLYNDNGELETEVNDSNETIGLFGITSCTGGHLVKLMLDAGYSVKALIAANDVVEVEHDQLQLVVGGLEDLEKLEQVIMEASYIICLLGDSFVKSDYNGGILVDFIKRIYPIMKESNTQVFIYQVSYAVQ